MTLMSTLMRGLAVISAFLILQAASAQQPQVRPGDVFRDCERCPELIVIPSGSFMMGSTEEEAVRENMPKMGQHTISSWERPRHLVSISYDFAMGRYEVTRDEFAFFLQESGYRPGRGCYSEAGYAQENSWIDPGFEQSESHPVVCISWTDAHAYVDWLSALTGRPYRLPSEAEWEYAARAGTQSARFWGDGIEEACDFANAADVSHMRDYKGKTFLDTYRAAGGMLPEGLAEQVPCDDGFVETAPVGSFKPNDFGLYDMLGNVWESIEDCGHFSYDGAPTDGSAWLDPKACDRALEGFSELTRVFRGASFSYPPYGLRSARRGIGGLDRRTWNRGFRVVMEVEKR